MQTSDKSEKMSDLSPKDIINDLLSKQRHRPRWHWYVLLAVAVAVLWGLRLHASHLKAAGAKPKGTAFPVAAAKAMRGDIPVFLDGLGSVTAFYTVNLHSRVDGQLMSVPIREGQYVREGDLLAQIDPRPYQAQLDSAQGQLAKDQALLTNAKIDLERYKTLVAQKAVPKQQYDTQVATVGQYEGNVEADKAAVDTAKLNLTYAHITSPISGRVGLRQVDPGNIVHAADANSMFVITQLHPIAVIFTLPEDNLPAVMKKLHEGGKLAVDAYNRDKTQKLASGSLLTVDNEIDPNSGTAKLKALFDNNDDALFPNQFVNVRLLLDTKRNEVIVPSAAIQRGSQGTYVYVIKPDNTVDLRLIKVGIVEGDSTSLDSGLEAGETVVTDGADKIQPGSTVTLPGAESGTTKAKGAGKRAGPEK
jgi:multidrug efflux system membrane fusion protein